MQDLEARFLYGTDALDAELPSLDELVTLVDELRSSDHHRSWRRDVDRHVDPTDQFTIVGDLNSQSRTQTQSLSMQTRSSCHPTQSRRESYGHHHRLHGGARMKAIEDSTVVDGEVVADNLILRQRDGTEINAGNVRGAAGEAAYVQGISLPAIKLNTSGPQLLSLNNPSVAGIAASVDWSPDGRLLAVGHETSPYLSVHKISGVGAIGTITSPMVMPPAAVTGVAWSPEGRFLVATHPTSPYFSAYIFDGNTLKAFPSPSILPAGVGYAVSWSPNGQFIAVGHANPPCFSVYKFNGFGFVKMTDPASTPTARGLHVLSVSWSPDGRFPGGWDTNPRPYLSVYSFDGAALVKVSRTRRRLPTGSGL
jgi:WD40 repeat protein